MSEQKDMRIAELESMLRDSLTREKEMVDRGMKRSLDHSKAVDDLLAMMEKRDARIAELTAQVQGKEFLESLSATTVVGIAELEALRKDAERYRWLQSLDGVYDCDELIPGGYGSLDVSFWHGKPTLDEAIDAAMAQEKSA